MISRNDSLRTSAPHARPAAPAVKRQAAPGLPPQAPMPAPGPVAGANRTRSSLTMPGAMAPRTPQIAPSLAGAAAPQAETAGLWQDLLAELEAVLEALVQLLDQLTRALQLSGASQTPGQQAPSQQAPGPQAPSAPEANEWPDDSDDDWSDEDQGAWPGQAPQLPVGRPPQADVPASHAPGSNGSDAPGPNGTDAPAKGPASTPAPGAQPAPTGPGPSQNLAGVGGPFGQDASQYEMTLNEEFDTFNTDLWNDAIWYEKGNPTKNYTVEDGKLKIWPEKDASGKFFNRTIDTDGKFYQKYGYFEMEAKLPKGKGVWPAFWLLNHDQPHPHRPEIDIMEAYPGGGPNSGWGDAELNPTAFAGTVWPTGPDSGGSQHKALRNLPNLSEGFHKYAAKWEPGKITFYFDGQEYYSVNADMNDRMYVLLDLWFGSASGQPDDSTPQGKDNAFEVNYVRAWQLKDQ